MIFSLSAPLEGECFQRWSRPWLQDWLEAEHKKVVKDSERILVLARNLRFEVEEKVNVPLPEAVPKGCRELEAKSKQLQEAVREVDENFLSVPVLKLAEEIREQAQRLRKSFENGPAKKKLDRYRLISREIEKRADAVRKRVRRPW